MDNLKKIDPEPFTIIVGIAGIVGGAASVIALADKYLQKAPSTVQRRLQRNLSDASDHIKHIEADVSILSDILMEADISNNAQFAPRTAAFLTKHQFRRYVSTADQLMKNLRALLKTIHRIDQHLPLLSENEFTQVTKSIVKIEDLLERVLRDRERSIHDVLKDLSVAIEATIRLSDTLSLR